MLPNTTKILIVDDMMTMRKLVSKALNELGYKDLCEANDGSKAWELFSAANANFGLIISDWNMPNCTGLDLLKRVRADSRFNTIPFILVTAESEKSQVMEALASGASGYVVKPFDSAAIKVQLDKVTQKKVA
jgi:two-component system chemotaxis response regulator CheY